MARSFESQDPGNVGSMGFLEADKPWDTSGRPRIRIVAPFWASESQRLEYEHAVEETRDMTPGTRMEAIRLRFGKGGVKRMPRVRQSRRERDAELQKLRAQVDEGDASAEYWHR